MDPLSRWAVLAGAVAFGVVLLYVNRCQTLISDVTFMKAMIPHHSIAINNAEKARISDPRVRALADAIIASQVREIREMKLLISDIEAHGERGTAPLPARPAVVTPDTLPKIREAVRWRTPLVDRNPGFPELTRARTTPSIAPVARWAYAGRATCSGRSAS